MTPPGGEAAPLVAWVQGTDDAADPRIAAALRAAGTARVAAIVTGAAPALTPVGAGAEGGVTVVVGHRQPAEEPSRQLVLAANVDDLDPRVWPGVLTALLAAGAVDAWLTPILMKKGRPAHTVEVLVPAEHRGAVLAVLVAETSTIGVREHAVGKVALDREFTTVLVLGEPVAVKIARHDGKVVNVMPEWSDIERVAAAHELPARRVLHLAQAAAAALWSA